MNFKEDYFIKSKISNYKDYTKKKYDLLTKELVDILGLKKEDYVVDFGCATGKLINCLKRNCNCKVKGTDISFWAINYGKKELGLDEELEFYNLNLLTTNPDYLLLLDVLEHIPQEDLEDLLAIISKGDYKGILVRVPVAAKEGENFALEVSKNDKTHIQIHDKQWWKRLFVKYGFNYCELVKGKFIYDSEGVFAAIFRKCQRK